MKKGQLQIFLTLQVLIAIVVLYVVFMINMLSQQPLTQTATFRGSLLLQLVAYFVVLLPFVLPVISWMAFKLNLNPLMAKRIVISSVIVSACYPVYFFCSWLWIL